jgi:hypothetical protein
MFWLAEQLSENGRRFFSKKRKRKSTFFRRHLAQGGSCCPSARRSERRRLDALAKTVASPPDYCAFGDSFAIVLSHLRITLRRAKGEADPPKVERVVLNALAKNCGFAA